MVITAVTTPDASKLAKVCDLCIMQHSQQGEIALHSSLAPANAAMGWLSGEELRVTLLWKGTLESTVFNPTTILRATPKSLEEEGRGIALDSMKTLLSRRERKTGYRQKFPKIGGADRNCSTSNLRRSVGSRNEITLFAQLVGAVFNSFCVGLCAEECR